LSRPDHLVAPAVNAAVPSAAPFSRANKAVPIVTWMKLSTCEG